MQKQDKAKPQENPKSKRDKKQAEDELVSLFSLFPLKNRNLERRRQGAQRKNRPPVHPSRGSRPHRFKHSP